MADPQPRILSLEGSRKAARQLSLEGGRVADRVVSFEGSEATGEVLPTLDFDFINQIYKIGTESKSFADAGLTFSRGSMAVCYDSTGKMVYAPHNLLLNSNNMAGAGWTATNVAKAASGSRLRMTDTVDAVATNHQLNHATAVSILAGNYTLQAKMKLISGNRTARLAMPSIFTAGPIAYFDLQAGTVAGVTGSGSATIQALGNGEYLCSLTAFSGAGGSSAFFGSGFGNGTVRDYQGDGTASFEIWDIQLEKTSSVRAYNATGASQYHGLRQAFNPSTLQPLGIMIEEARTNILLDTEGDQTTYPTRSNVADAAASIQSFAKSIEFGDNSVSRYAYKKASVTAGTTYAFSFVVEMLDGLGPPSITQSPSSGDLGVIFEGGIPAVPVSIEVLGGNRYRVKISKAAAITSATSSFGIVKYNTQSNRQFKASGYQLEVGSFSTSYIQTGAAAVTRSADVLRLNPAGWLRSDRNGTFFLEEIPENFTGTSYILSGQNSNLRIMYIGVAFRAYDGVTIAPGTAPVVNVVNKLALSFSETKMTLATNGTVNAEVAHNGTFNDVTLFGLGYPTNSTAASGVQYYRKLRYWPRRLPSSHITVLTA